MLILGDSLLLLEALKEMRKILINITKQDVLLISPTLASIAMNIFKLMYLKKNYLAWIPEGGYERFSMINFNFN